MPTGHIMMAMSLDGFVARKDHALDWLMKQQTADEDHGFTSFMDSIDVLVMGSGSLKTVLGFDQWPYDKKVIVMSHSMTSADIPDDLKDKIEVSTKTPVDLMDELGERGVSRVYVDGGAVIRSFLRAGLISDMKLSIVPILIGDGLRIFEDFGQDIDLKLQETSAHPSGLVDLVYSVT